MALKNIFLGKYISGTFHKFTSMDTHCKTSYSNRHLFCQEESLNLVFDFTLSVRTGFCFKNQLMWLLERKENETVGSPSTKFPIYSLQKTAECIANEEKILNEKCLLDICYLSPYYSFLQMPRDLIEQLLEIFISWSTNFLSTYPSPRIDVCIKRTTIKSYCYKQGKTYSL